ncbi:hypothetical protein COU76_00110 [Candidatus Peregrinibacteria bacterium CG10_big_fil_rev_8_21_14_0_10_49_10]|nr:MAG: hypothetical protein COU76_00110 [Candidatus Peregrinibacteria bacterium CG10_big_fil_rev_8_21_14_0_10_49_10]
MQKDGMRKSQNRKKRDTVGILFPFYSMSKKSKTGSALSLYGVVNWTVCLILFVVMLISLKGAYILHAELGRIAFGSSNSSFSLLAAAICTALWSKSLRRCMCCCGEKK